MFMGKIIAHQKFLDINNFVKTCVIVLVTHSIFFFLFGTLILLAKSLEQARLSQLVRAFGGNNTYIMVESSPAKSFLPLPFTMNYLNLSLHSYSVHLVLHTAQSTKTGKIIKKKNSPYLKIKYCLCSGTTYLQK